MNAIENIYPPIYLFVKEIDPENMYPLFFLLVKEIASSLKTPQIMSPLYINPITSLTSIAPIFPMSNYNSSSLQFNHSIDSVPHIY